MNAPIAGSWLVEVRAVRPYTIHSDLYYELHVVRTDESPHAEPGQLVFAIRVPQHATAEEPRRGDQLSVSFLMGQVTEVRKC